MENEDSLTLIIPRKNKTHPLILNTSDTLFDDDSNPEFEGTTVWDDLLGAALHPSTVAIALLGE